MKRCAVLVLTDERTGKRMPVLAYENSPKYRAIEYKGKGQGPDPGDIADSVNRELGLSLEDVMEIAESTVRAQGVSS